MNKTLMIGMSAVAAGALLASGNPATAQGPEPKHTFTRFLPSDFAGDDQVTLTKALGPDDVWMFVTVYEDRVPRVLGRHWDGTKWNEVVLPEGVGFVNGIAGGAADLWMVGVGSENTTTSDNLVLHFDGRTWEIVKRIPRFDHAPDGLAVLRDGSVRFFVATNKVTTVWRYDRGTWTSTTAAKRRIAASTLPNGTIWAVTRPGIRPGHFDGRTWTTVKAPSRALLGCTKTDPCDGVDAEDLVALSPDTVVMSVSVRRKNGGQRFSVVRWNGKKWSVLYRTGADSVASLTPDGKGGFWAVRDKPHTDVAQHYTKAGKLVSYGFDLPRKWLSYDLTVGPGGGVIAYGSNFRKAMAWKLAK
ncbi:hypothetical protein EDD29_8788 [Actinocorallia herbida]|uniref:Uncharacterized protein n=1 Tax=Actinocorallia herbida TaxID=58109 RepID=A0A3N1DBZ3_9ACTN|nr:hypothetical protein [Actinocorallia herbida]ROO91044.1 hypothetical protein EDD29_8788 [Actinocorallia herbida]